jgi:FO synthase
VLAGLAIHRVAPQPAARAGAGDKPELLYPEAATELAAMGHASTLNYVAAAAAAVLRDTGLLPHINAGGGRLAANRGPPLAGSGRTCALPVQAPKGSLPPRARCPPQG